MSKRKNRHIQLIENWHLFWPGWKATPQESEEDRRRVKELKSGHRRKPKGER